MSGATGQLGAPEHTPGTFLYFAYGASMDAESLHRTCPGAEFVTIARLPGHRLAFSIESKRSWLGGVCDVIPVPLGSGDSADSEVWGAVWRIPDDEAAALDDHEGLNRQPPAYQHYSVEVITPMGATLACRSYCVAAPDPAGFAPSRTFKDTVVRAARAVALPEGYVAYLESIEDNGVTVGA